MIEHAESGGIPAGSQNGSSVDCKPGRRLTESRAGSKRFVRRAILPQIVISESASARDLLIVSLFTDDHLTMREIGFRVGLSGAMVSRILHRLGVPREAGTWVRSTCLQCGAPIEVERAQFRRHAERRFCSLACNWAWRECNRFVQSRPGGRRARKIAALYVDLLPGYVVHHHDHDQTNNAVWNLAVFASDSLHKSYHHGNPNAQPIWDGRTAAAVGTTAVTEEVLRTMPAEYTNSESPR